MLSVKVAVIGEVSPAAERTRQSVRLALGEGGEVAVCGEAGIKGLLEEDEVLHIIPAGTYVMPGFYRAMRTTLEHTRRDYVFCGCLVFGDEALTPSPSDARFNLSQMLVRTWVLREMDYSGGSLLKAYRYIVGNYRGEEVPHFLCIEAQRQGGD